MPALLSLKLVTSHSRAEPKQLKQGLFAEVRRFAKDKNIHRPAPHVFEVLYVVCAFTTRTSARGSVPWPHRALLVSQDAREQTWVAPAAEKVSTRRALVRVPKNPQHVSVLCAFCAQSLAACGSPRHTLVRGAIWCHSSARDASFMRCSAELVAVPSFVRS